MEDRDERCNETNETAVRENGVTILAAVPLLFHMMHEKLMQRLLGGPFLRRSLMGAALSACGWMRRELGVTVGRLLSRTLRPARPSQRSQSAAQPRRSALSTPQAEPWSPGGKKPSKNALLF